MACAPWQTAKPIPAWFKEGNIIAVVNHSESCDCFTMERSRSTAGPLTISNPAFSRMKSPIRGSAKAFSDSLSGLETMEFREAVKRLRKRSNRLYEQLKEARFREMVQVKEKQELITQHVSLRKKYHSLCLHFAKLLQFLEREGNEFDELDLLGVLGGHSWGSVWESTRAEYFTSNKSAIEDVFNMRMPDEFVDVEVEFGPGNFGFGLEECRDDPSYSTQVCGFFVLHCWYNHCHYDDYYFHYHYCHHYCHRCVFLAGH